MPGEADRLVADPLHQVAVGGDDIGVMVDKVVAELSVHQPLGERHADGRREPLAERAGGGLDARRMAIFGVACRLRAELAEALDLGDRHILVAEEIERRIKQHRAVPGGEDEAVAVRPVRIGGVEFQMLGEEHGRDVGRAHRQTRMAGLRLLHRVHGKEADRIGHQVVIDSVAHSLSPVRFSAAAAKSSYPPPARIAR